MLVVETIAKIRRAYFQDKKSIKQICRELRVSRNTVRKVIRSGATELTYERTIQPLPKIGPWTGKLNDMLAVNARKPKRERPTGQAEESSVPSSPRITVGRETDVVRSGLRAVIWPPSGAITIKYRALHRRKSDSSPPCKNPAVPPTSAMRNIELARWWPAHRRTRVFSTMPKEMQLLLEQLLLLLALSRFH